MSGISTRDIESSIVIEVNKDEVTSAFPIMRACLTPNSTSKKGSTAPEKLNRTDISYSFT